MTFEAKVRQIFQTLLDENKGDHRLALWDLAHRYAMAMDGVSWALLRRMSPATEGKIDDVPDPVDDSWISTGRQKADA